MLEILYKSKNAVVIRKPYGMPSEPDQSGSPDAMTTTSRMLLQSGENDKLWLVHRLDRVVGGVMIFARTRAVAAEISDIIKEHQLVKEYIAIVEGTPEEGEYFNYLFKDARLGRAVVCDENKNGAKSAHLTLKRLECAEHNGKMRSLVEVVLHTGRFHQIRAQLSHRGTPIVGDGKYGSHDGRAKCIALFSGHIAIDLKNERIDVRSIPDLEYPWSLFCENERIKLK